MINVGAIMLCRMICLATKILEIIFKVGLLQQVTLMGIIIIWTAQLTIWRISKTKTRTKTNTKTRVHKILLFVGTGITDLYG